MREVTYLDQHLHSTKMDYISLKSDYMLFSKLKPSIQIDGDQWCVLYGDNLQDGIAGFGNSPYLAILDFNKEWYKQLKETK